MGRRDHADVDVDRLGLADAADLAAVEDAQELRLEIERELADLVEEQRAAVGGLDQALLVGAGAGEAALGVAEQLARDQLVRDRAAVDDDERPLARGGCVRWIASAIASLPVPVSPWSRIVASVGAAFASSANSRFIGGGRAEDVAEPVTCPLAEVDAGVDRLDVHLGVLAETEPRRAGQHDAADARAAVLGAVRRVEIADLDAIATHADLEVVARHRRVGEHEVVVGVGADHRRALVEHVLLALIGPGHDAEPEAALERAARSRHR